MTQQFTLRPGQYLVQDISSASGGITYQRNKDARQEAGEGYEQDIRTHKKVDHEALIADSEELIQRARYVLRANAANTVIGWITDGVGLKRIREGFETSRGDFYPGINHLEQLAAQLNDKAKRAGSARRCRVAIVPIALSIDNEAAAAEIARTVRDICKEMYEVCRAGDPDGLQRILLRAKNLERLATGMQQDAIVFAVECARAARKELRKAIKGQPDKAHERLLSQCGASLNLEEIEACIGMFSEGGATAAGFLAEVA